MRWKRIWAAAAAASVVLVFAGVEETLSYTDRNRKITELIQVAYMNGAADALALDIGEIRRMQNDEARLRRVVQNATYRYLVKVTRMNRWTAESGESRGRPGSVRHRTGYRQ